MRLRSTLRLVPPALALGALGAIRARAEEAPRRLIAFGDSITSGYLAAHPYAVQLAAARQRPLVNFAVAGSHAAEQRQAIADAAASITPDDWVVWLCGYNDMRAGTPLAAFRATVDAALTDLRARTPWIWLGNCPRMTAAGYALPVGPYGSDAAVAAINAELAAAADAAGVRLVDVSAAYDPANVLADLVHPHAAGHRQIAQAFARATALTIWQSLANQ